VKGILKYCVRGLLGDEQNQALNRFTDAIAALCSTYQDQTKLEQLKENLNLALALVESAFPLSFQVNVNTNLQFDT